MFQNEIAHQTASLRHMPSASQSSDVPSKASGKSLNTACNGWPNTRRPLLIRYPPLRPRGQDRQQQDDERDDGDQAVNDDVRDGQRLATQVVREHQETADGRAKE